MSKATATATAPQTEVPTEEAKAKTREVKLTAEQNKQIAALDTWSAKIRYLNTQGYNRSEIARALGKIYQHVRNVLEADIAKKKKEQ